MSLNRRRSPRVAKGLAVNISNVNGEKFNALTLNVSRNGFGLQCSTMDRNELTPQGDFVDMGKPVEFDVSLQLPDVKAPLDHITAKCRVLYSRRLANSICEIGMRFMTIDGDGEERLVRFLKQVEAEMA